MMDKPILVSGPTGPYAHGYKMCIVQYADRTTKSITLHKYIYEQRHGHRPSGMHVHHKNGDKSDNRLYNLDARTIADHTRLHNSPSPRKTYTCPWCGKNFERDDSKVRHNQERQKKAGPFCNRSCGAGWGREKQLGRL